MTLNPGQSTTLSMTFSMKDEKHAGPHDFRVRIPIAGQDEMELTVRSNWVE